MLGEPGAPGPAGPGRDRWVLPVPGPDAGNTLSIIALAIAVVALAATGGVWYLSRSS